MKIHLLTVLYGTPANTPEDPVGPHIEKIILHHYPDCVVTRSICALNADHIHAAYMRNPDADFIITSGGTGILPVDIVPEITVRFCDRLLTGISEMLRFQSYQHSPYAALSRGTAGIKGSTIIINLPGSLKAALLCTRLLIPLISQASRLLRGETHESFEPGIMGKC